MAITISNSTVSDMHSSMTMMSSSVHDAASRPLCALHSCSTPPSTGAAMAKAAAESSGASTAGQGTTRIEWITAEIGEVAPAHDVSGRTRDGSCSGNTTKERSDNIPSPCPTSSLFALCFVPVIPSSITWRRAEIRLRRALPLRMPRRQQGANRIPVSANSELGRS